MSKTKAALELGIELNALQEYLEDDLLAEYYETTQQYTNALAFAKWVKSTHTRNELLKLGLTGEVTKYLCNMAYEFVSEFDDPADHGYDYIEIAEGLFNYYRQAWNWDHEPVARFNVRKHVELIRERILLERGI